ncbi:MAG: hypothetical protein I3273_04195 [Candidatus Moeniiplasma glomeromycotorum]|nr:hypothetical protein [Candidatus Moeniiplasma glomeromycotorum]
MRCNRCGQIIKDREEHFQGANKYTSGGYFCQPCWKKKQEISLGLVIFAIIFFAMIILFVIWLWKSITDDK